MSSFSKISALGGLIAFASQVTSHGTVTGIVADGVYYEGYYANFQYLQTQPVVVGWSTPEDLGNGFIAPDAYGSSDIICHLGATNAKTSASVKAGGTVELQWTAWPTSHKGPVIDYLASCNGDCTTVDKTTLEFFKIDGVGLLDDTTLPGNWASDTLIANNNSWTVTIPPSIAPGNYVLRHEIIALHSAGSADGAQNYPFCFNLEVTGSGTATPSGTFGTALYTENDPGILVNIYNTLSTYIVPGPTLFSGAVSVSQTQAPSATAAETVGSATSAAAAAVTAAVSSDTVAPVITSSASVPVASLTAPYSNSTTFSTKKSESKSKSKSACKLHSTTSTIFSVPAPATTTSVAAAATPTTKAVHIQTTPVVSIATVVPTTTISTSVPETTASVAPSLPEGTTLDTLLGWLSAFYDKFAGTKYDGNTVVSRRHARRHAKDIVA